MQAIFNFFFLILLKSSTLEPRENLKCSSLEIDFLEKMAKTGKRFGHKKKFLQDKRNTSIAEGFLKMKPLAFLTETVRLAF